MQIMPMRKPINRPSKRTFTSILQFENITRLIPLVKLKTTMQNWTISYKGSEIIRESCSMLSYTRLKHIPWRRTTIQYCLSSHMRVSCNQQDSYQSESDVWRGQHCWPNLLMVPLFGSTSVPLAPHRVLHSSTNIVWLQRYTMLLYIVWCLY